ncbi:MAG TPA: hypothetical protein VMS64_30110 [Candidatus Methylomirabilis sp.]|nr:hypothetical protein [Candidatus Methylomirabilis sp.]
MPGFRTAAPVRTFRPTALSLVLLFASFWIFVGIDYGLWVYDEGSLLLGAREIQAGAMPMADFWTAYSPGMFWIVASLLRIFGEEMLVLRVFHAAIVLGIVAVSFPMVRFLTGSHRWAILGSTWVALYGGAVRVNAGYPPVLCLFLAFLGLLAIWRSGDKPSAALVVVAGALSGATALIRHDFGLYLVSACAVALLLQSCAPSLRLPSATAEPRLAHRLSCFLLGMAPLIVLGYGLLLSRTGFARAYDLLFVFPLRIFPAVRSLPLPRPALVRLHLTEHLGAVLAHDLACLATYGAALAAVVGVLASGWSAVRSGTHEPRRDALLSLSVLALLLINQFRVRPAEPQGWPLAVTGLLILCGLLVQWGGGDGARTMIKAVVAVLVTASLVGAGGYRQFVLVRARYASPTEAVDSPRARGMRIGEEQRDINTLLRQIQDHRQAGDRLLFSGVIDHDQLVSNDVLIYFLSNSMSPSPYYAELVPGVTDTRQVQERMVDDLRRSCLQLAVLIGQRSAEPNRSSVNTQVGLLNRFVGEQFHRIATVGEYQILKRNTVDLEPHCDSTRRDRRAAR